MARPNSATQAKRARELKKQDKRKDKAERRLERTQNKSESSKSTNGEDPDLAGIYPGPQQPRDE